MKANITLLVKWIGIRINDEYVKYLLTTNYEHIFLPF